MEDRWGSRWRPCGSEVDEAALDIGVDELHGYTVADVEPLKPLTTRPSVVGPEMRTQVPLSEAPVTMPRNVAPMREDSSSAAADFATCRSTLAALRCCSVQCAASAASSVLL